MVLSLVLPEKLYVEHLAQCWADSKHLIKVKHAVLTSVTHVLELNGTEKTSMARAGTTCKLVKQMFYR